MAYLITGATGNVGALVVENAIARGERPRVFARDAQKARARFGDRVDVYIGDLENVETLKPALAGVTALFLVNSGPQLAALDKAAAEAAKAAGVKRFVKLSSSDAHEQVGTGVWHAQGEAAIRDTGIAFTFVRPSGFMANALFWAHSIKTEGVVRSSTGSGKIPFIHSQDIADVATCALTSEKYLGETLPITGPEALSYGEMTAKIGAAIGKELKFQTIADEEERCHMGAHGDSEVDIAAHLSIYRAIREGRLAQVTSTIERVLGRKPLPFDQWVRENVAAFL